MTSANEADAKMEDGPTFDLQFEEFDENDEFQRFKTVKPKEKDNIYEERIRPNTQKATKLWVNCFKDYLKEKKLATLEETLTENLPNILSDFYTELRKADGENDYKISTLKCIRAALNRHFKEKRGVDIISDPRFIQANEMFKGVARKAKKEGRGEVDSKPPIEPEDLKKISDYIDANMSGPPNPAKLQEAVLFYVIYYMCRRGRQNLRAMKKDTFAIDTDASGKRFVFQQRKELDKNHKEDDMNPSSQARIYEIPGT